MTNHEREYAYTPLGVMPVWHPVLDAKKVEYGGPFEVTSSEHLLSLVREHIRDVQGEATAWGPEHERDIQLSWPTAIELYVYEGTLRICGVDCGPMESARWRSVVPVRFTGRVVLAWAAAEGRL